MSQTPKKIVVTGGAGFLGAHLCRALLDRGENVTCVDNISTGSIVAMNALRANAQFKFIEHDVCEPIELKADQIYNLACPASPVHYQSDPVKTLKTSVIGAMNMLELAKGTGARILQSSTSEIYGDPKVHPQPEAYWGHVNPIGIRACYDEGKRAAETFFFDFHRMYNVDIRVARIFNTYGPGMLENDGRVVSNFIVNALRGNDIEIYGDGLQTRSFCYVQDLIEGLIKLMNSDMAPLPVNLGNPVEFSVLQLAEMIIELTNSSSNIVRRSLPLDDPMQRKPDISRARKLLDWTPTTDLKSGLRKTIKHFEAESMSEISRVSDDHLALNKA